MATQHTWQGKTQPLRAWARELGLHHATIAYRLRIGMTFEQAVTKPRHFKGEQDLTGQMTGQLTVLAREGRPGRRPERWRVRCACGTERVYPASRLVSSAALRSCGCLGHAHEVFTVRRAAGGLSGTAEYATWRRIRELCLAGQGDTAYAVYAGRGIRMCERWVDDFTAFYADMGPRPERGYCLDRVNPLGHFEPGNCCWVSRSEFVARRGAIWLTHEGQTLTLTQWSERTGLAQKVLQLRLNQGWTPQQVLTTPEGVTEQPTPDAPPFPLGALLAQGAAAVTLREAGKRG